MKKAILSLTAAAITFSSFAQESSGSGRENLDASLPAWVIDLNLKGGSLSQSLSSFNTESYYTNALNANISDLKFRNGGSLGFDLQLGYFFGKQRNWGVGAGLLYFSQTGDVSMDKFHIEYQSTDFNGDVFRQSLTSTGQITESITTTNINIPILLKYKKQFSKKWGFTADAGLVINLQAKNEYSTNAAFDYEAIYKFVVQGSNVVAVYDNSPTPDPNDWLITKADYIAKYPDGDVNAYFAQQRDLGYNVGINKKPSKTSGNTSYNTGSVGFLIQPAVSYMLCERLALNVGAFYMMQSFKNTENTANRLTDEVGSYNSMLKGVKTSTQNVFGGNIGLRYYVGKAKDSDNDGIPDKRDLCPTVPGLPQFQGCPDSDGDGITDASDECPSVAGLPDFHGCPDTDGDGIEDEEDQCPEKAGLVQFHGCPDTDGDGIVDNSDDCPTQAGLPKFNGCPDTDGDGIPDKSDKCPTVKGDAANGGCPPVVETPKKAELGTNVIYFGPNSARLNTSDKGTLDAVVSVLNQYPDATLVISGYTDNSGKERANKELSSLRAAHVKKYLVQKGINASRISTSAHGDDSPAQSNKTASGRAHNRRVVLTLK